MRRRNEAKVMPRVLVVLMVAVGLVFLGPPAMGLLTGLIGLTIGLLAIALKVGALALGVYAAVLLLRALFGSSSGGQPRRLAEVDAFGSSERVDPEKEALDRELARVIAAQQR